MTAEHREIGSAPRRLALERVAFAVPGAIETISGGYAYARRLLELTPMRLLALPEGFPDPDAATLRETAARLAAWEGPLLIDGLAYGAFPPALADAVGPRSVVLLHHPLDREGDVSPEAAAARAAREKRALQAARGVVVTSRETARDLVDRFQAPRARIALAEPGVEPAPRAPCVGDPPKILSVGAVIPRKGHDLLIAALACLPRGLAYTADVVGPLGRAPEHERAVRAAIAEAGLGARIRLRGALAPAALARAYAEADLAVLPSRHEGYGMAATEALARGIPLIAGRGGALAETAAAGVVVDPEDERAFAAALRRLLEDPAARRAAADRAWRAAAALPRWEDAARRVGAALAHFLGGGDER